MSHIWDILPDLTDIFVWLVPDVNIGSKRSKSALPSKWASEEIAKAWGGEVLNMKQHASFLGPIHKMADELKLGYKPLVVVTDKIAVGHDFMQSVANASGFPQVGVLAVNKNMLKLTGDTTTQPISPMLQSTMGHELGHLKYDKAGVLIKQMTPILLPASALLALLYYDRAAARRKNTRDILAAQHDVHTMADSHIEALDQTEQGTEKDQSTMKPESKIYKPLINIARYAAVGMLGLAGGLMLSRHMSLASEYRADRVALDLVKDPEMLIASTKQVDRAHANAMCCFFSDPKMVEKIRPKNWRDTLRFIRNNLLVRTIDAHPSLEQSIANINSHAENLGLKEAASHIHIR